MCKIKHWIVISIIVFLLPVILIGTGSYPGFEESSAQTAPPGGDFMGPFPTDPDFTLPVNNEDGPDLANLVEVADLARPAVVAIEVEIISEDIFNQPVEQRGAGSGWIFDSSGLIATNHHVIEGASTITVILGDQRTFNATSVVSDPVTDLAVVKVDASDLPVLTVGDSETVQPGQMVAAMGNALGRGISITGGWISRQNVTLSDGEGMTLYDLLETDAAINPGNSGGPLLNMEGEVIGITNAKISSAAVEGVAFAIGSQTFVPVIEDLVRQGAVSRPYLGVSLQTLTPDVASVLGIPVEQGVLVAEVDAGGPAAAAGMQTGDVIVSINGENVTEAVQVVMIVRESNIGDTLSISFIRDGETQTAEVTLAEAPSS